MLLHYFGEKNYHECGQCDVCLSRKSHPKMQEKEFDAMADEVYAIIASE
jgi:ATP-dependent DNA helicase RecQ